MTMLPIMEITRDWLRARIQDHEDFDYQELRHE